jgi:hypothetical protein
MGRTRSIHGGGEECIQNCSRGVRVWTGFILIKKGSSGGLL